MTKTTHPRKPKKTPAPTTGPIVDEWKGCYPSNWKGLIIPEAMAHPAKYSSKLIARIYAHARDEGWVQAGDRVIDPFGGVALGGLDAMKIGLHWTGIELERRFVDLGDHYDCPGFSKKDWVRFYGRRNVNFKYGFHWCPECVKKMTDYNLPPATDDGQLLMFANPPQADRAIPHAEPHVFHGNIHLWNDVFSALDIQGMGTARLLNGDSRKLLEVIAYQNASVAISSPPYADSVNDKNRTMEQFDWSKGKRAAMGTSTKWQERIAEQSHYGATEGQLGAMPDQDFDAAVSSPPYNLPMSQSHNGKNGGARGDTPSEPGAFARYGNTEGNLEGMSDHGFDLALSSPPFLQSSGGIPEPKPGGVIDKALHDRHLAGNAHGNAYGQSEGQLSSMADDGFDAAISSPPFENSLSRDFIDAGHRRAVARASGISNAEHVSPIDADSLTIPSEVYGPTDGQLGNMKGGDFSAAISSPPYADSVNQSNGANDDHARLHRKAQAGVDISRAENRGGPNSVLNQPQVYGDSDGQLGAMEDSPDSFWLSARQIVDQVYAALKPGGHALWVVKGYVKGGKYIDFPDQWRRLCEAAGFTTLHEHRCLLVHHRGTSLTLEGEKIEHKTESKSFFRRLAEKKGSPRIDWETVLCMVKAEGGGQNAEGHALAVSSPPYAEARIGQESGQESCGRGDQYGGSNGQLGAMKDSGFETSLE